MSTTEDASRCAACGEGGDALNVLFEGCNLVKFCCNAECEERAAEIYDELLFRDPPRNEECPLCCLPLPHGGDIASYTCCGKTVCIGCLQAMLHDQVIDVDVCPFCREKQTTSDSEIIERLRRRMKNGDGRAYFEMAEIYQSGEMGFQKNHRKALELGLRAGELGYPGGYFLLARAYLCGEEGVFVDNEKAVQYMGLAAIGGHVLARCCLGKVEVVDGRVQRALEHFKIAARAGWEKGALDEMKQLYMEGHATKDDYRESLLAFQKANSEMKSEQRDMGKTLHALKKIQDEMKSKRDT